MPEKRNTKNCQEWEFSEPLISTPLTVKWGGFISVLFVVIVVVAAVYGEYPTVERLEGTLAPHTGLSISTATISGHITQIFATEGERVQEGQVLARVAASAGSPESVAGQFAVSEEMQNRQSEIQNEIRNLAALAEGERQSLTEMIRSMTAERTLIDQELSIAEERLFIREEKLKKVDRLVDSGSMPNSSREQAQDDFLESKSRIASILTAIENRDREIARVQVRLGSIDRMTSVQISSLKRDYSELEQTKLERSSVANPIVVAPISGTLLGVEAKVGEMLQPGDPIAFVVSDAAKLVAELCANGSQIPRIESGQTARLRYPAFPIEKYGLYTGSVVSTSRIARQGRDQVCYLVKVELDSQTISTGEQSFPLLAGMPVAADLLVDNRTLVEVLLGPLVRARESL